jgi:hypothetical protein
VPYKHLKGGIEFIDAIPKNPSGKMVRFLFMNVDVLFDYTSLQLRRVLRDQARKLKAMNRSRL